MTDKCTFVDVDVYRCDGCGKHFISREMTSILDLLRGRCPLWRGCPHYKKESVTCNSVDPSYCGIYRTKERRR